MSNVITFPGHYGDLKHTSYTAHGDDSNDDLGIATLDNAIEVVRLNDTQFEVITPDGSQVHDRKSLAEFAWVLATFIDSEQRGRPDCDLVGCDYPAGE